jgi:hypothetical protein
LNEALELRTSAGYHCGVLTEVEMNGNAIVFSVGSLVLAFLLLGCSSNSTKPAATEPSAAPAIAPETAPAKSDSKVDECGKYTVDVDLPEQFACKEDADCAWTGLRPGNCTRPLCPGHYVAGNKAWVEAAEKLHHRICDEAKFGYCIRVKCVNKEPKGAVCTEGRCQLVPAD